jgi:trans-2,3-dihydro-3-hydroxyanthranilate isomerase
MSSGLKLPFTLVNVFTRDGGVLTGNPLCVFEDARGLDRPQMQALAQQMNLSETTFVFPSTTADATVRIFTPAFEMPFAGHPTLGTAFVIHTRRQVAASCLTLEMHAGLIRVAQLATRTWQLQTNGNLGVRRPDASHEQLATMLGLASSDVDERAFWIDTGSEQLIVPLLSPAAVAAAAPVPGLLATYGRSAKRSEPIAYVWAWQNQEQRTVVARTFFMAHGAVVEDPATGSACANLGGWLRHHRFDGPRAIEVSQGDSIGRPSTLRLTIDAAQQILVAGDIIEIGRGLIEL